MAIVYTLAGLFTVYSIALAVRTSFSAGTIVIWLLTAVLLCYSVFHGQIDAFAATGFGRVLKLLLLVGMGLYATLFLFVAVSGYTNTIEGDEDAIIVLGAGLRGEEVTEVLARRLQVALDAWQQNPACVIVVTGGQGPREAVPEAVAMQRWLVARGVPEGQIIMEDKSTSTEENLRFAMELLEQRGIAPDAKVGVATNAFHIYRALQYAGREGFTSARALPASINLTAVLPSYLREVLAVLALWIFK